MHTKTSKTYHEYYKNAHLRTSPPSAGRIINSPFAVVKRPCQGTPRATKSGRRSHRLSAEGSSTTTPADAERRLRPPNHATTDPEGGEPERGIPQLYSSILKVLVCT